MNVTSSTQSVQEPLIASLSPSTTAHAQPIDNPVPVHPATIRFMRRQAIQAALERLNHAPENTGCLTPVMQLLKSCFTNRQKNHLEKELQVIRAQDSLDKIVNAPELIAKIFNYLNADEQRRAMRVLQRKSLAPHLSSGAVLRYLPHDQRGAFLEYPETANAILTKELDEAGDSANEIATSTSYLLRYLPDAETERIAIDQLVPQLEILRNSNQPDHFVLAIENMAKALTNNTFEAAELNTLLDTIIRYLPCIPPASQEMILVNLAQALNWNYLGDDIKPKHKVMDQIVEKFPDLSDRNKGMVLQELALALGTKHLIGGDRQSAHQAFILLETYLPQLPHNARSTALLNLGRALQPGWQMNRALRPLAFDILLPLVEEDLAHNDAPYKAELNEVLTEILSSPDVVAETREYITRLINSNN